MKMKQLTRNLSTHVSRYEKKISLEEYIKDVKLQTTKYLGIYALSGATSGSIIAAMDKDSAFLFLISTLIPMIPSLYCAYKVRDKSLESETKNKYAYYMHAGLGMISGTGTMTFDDSIPAVAIATAVLVGGSAVSSVYLPKGKLLPAGPTLYVGLLGLSLFSIGGIFLPVLIIVTSYTAHDTHVLIDDWKNDKMDVVNHSANYSWKSIMITII
jgi:FtsH-binding integral membrane protein